MSDHARGRPPRIRWWTRLLDRIDRRVSGLIDDDARRRGWTVMTLPGTRTHVYRDPRWDRRRLCELCAGSGCEGAVTDPATTRPPRAPRVAAAPRRINAPCPPCDGTGVVTDRPVRHLGES